MSKEGKIKICDFGIKLNNMVGSSKILEPFSKNTPYIVSRYYRAPELLLCIHNYSTAIDVWGNYFIIYKAAGCILAELITLQPLFCADTEGNQLFKIVELMGSPSEEEFNYYR